MTREQFLLMCVFGVVALFGYGLFRLFLPRRDGELDRRLQDARPASTSIRRTGPDVANMLSQMAQVAGKPFEPKTREEQSALRRRLGHAGFYSTSSMHLFSGAKAILLAIGLLGGYLSGLWLEKMLMGVAIGGLAGYLLPVMWLDMRIKKQQKALEHGLPDALDLMVVCVEAGLTLDAAMQRVGREINLAHPELAREMAITHMESQMGLPRSNSLRNLGQRTGSTALQSLSAMLIQAERFGTGIAQALRVHAESLRIKRRYAAEAMAAKAAVKMNFPLVFFVFPAMLIVIAGPGIIKLMESGFLGGN